MLGLRHISRRDHDPVGADRPQAPAAHSAPPAHRSRRPRRAAASPRRHTHCPAPRCGRRAEWSRYRAPSRRSRPHRRRANTAITSRAPPPRAPRRDGNPDGVGGEQTIDFAHTGHARRNRAHEQRARIRCASARCIHADSRERIGTTTDDDAGLRRHLARARQERCDAPSRCSRAARSSARAQRRDRARRAHASHCARGTSSDSSVTPSKSRASARSASSPSRRTRSMIAAVVARTHDVIAFARAITIARTRRASSSLSGPRARSATSLPRTVAHAIAACAHGTSRSMRVTRIPSPPSARSCEIVR